MDIQNLMKELLDMEEYLWQRRMKLLSQYQGVQEMRQRISQLERALEEETELNMKEIIELVEDYEKDPRNLELLRYEMGELAVYVVQRLIDRVKQIRDMRAEVDELEREIMEIDVEIDRKLEKLQEYKRRIQGMQ